MVGPLIGIPAPSWLKERAIIEKKVLNIPMRFWFGFINSNLMPSQNESALRHTKAALVVCIMDWKELNLRSIIALEILFRAKQEQTFLPFPSFVTALCKQARVSRNKKIDTKVTPLASTDIQRIEAEYLREKEDSASKKLANRTLVIDVESLEFGTKV